MIVTKHGHKLNLLQIIQLTERYLVFSFILLLSSTLFILLSNEHFTNKKQFQNETQVKLSRNFTSRSIVSTSDCELCGGKQRKLKKKYHRENFFSWSNEYNIWTINDTDISKIKEINVESKIIRPNGVYSFERSQMSRDSNDDRIINQLLLTPDDIVILRNKTDRKKIFKIFPPDDQLYPIGRELFLKNRCPINQCHITYNKTEANALILLNSDVIDEPVKRNPNQIWIAYLLESPVNTFDKRLKRLKRGNHIFNWTASYRIDSDVVTPYSKFVPYSSQLKNYLKLKAIDHRFAQNYGCNDENLNIEEKDETLYTIDDSLWSNFNKLLKTKEGKVAWFVSNCYSSNKRLEYARDLSKYIRVDIYGKCGNFSCPKWNETGCLNSINIEYKFYLSFENSNCRHYLTEKLFKNALGYNDLNHLIVPIVMGAPREDYENLAPPGSFIHVDDFNSTKELAEYLKLLDNNDQLYYGYFRWKLLGQFIDTSFMCRICAMLHHNYHENNKKLIVNSQYNIKEWWWNYNSKEACTS